jgi:hypothetical protein
VEAAEGDLKEAIKKVEQAGLPCQLENAFKSQVRFGQKFFIFLFSKQNLKSLKWNIKILI